MRALIIILFAAIISGCTASQVKQTEEALLVEINHNPPPYGAKQVGPISAKHGGGCGLYGAEGNFEGAASILRNKAATLGANYVQITDQQGEHVTGLCLDRSYTINGLAFKVSNKSESQDVPNKHPEQAAYEKSTEVCLEELPEPLDNVQEIPDSLLPTFFKCMHEANTRYSLAMGATQTEASRFALLHTVVAQKVSRGELTREEGSLQLLDYALKIEERIEQSKALDQQTALAQRQLNLENAREERRAMQANQEAINSLFKAFTPPPVQRTTCTGNSFSVNCTHY